MKPKLTEQEKFKYWVDSEFTIVHIMLAVVLLELTKGWVWTIVLVAYIIYAGLYLLTRLAIIAADDPDYLKAPKK